MTIHWYGVCMAVAFLVGLAHWTWVARRDGRDSQFCSDLLFWVMIAGVLGGRVAYILANLPYYTANPERIIALWEGGLIYYGGFLGAIAAVAMFAHRRRIPLVALLDFAITALPLAHAIGRVGCFLNGCCFGSVLPHWPGVAFPAQSLAWSRQVELGLIGAATTCSLPVHPVQLYETAWNLALYPVLLILYRRRPAVGTVTGVYLLLYPVGRLILESFRGTEREHWGPLSAAQGISLLLMAGGVFLLVRARRRSPA